MLPANILPSAVTTSKRLVNLPQELIELSGSVSTSEIIRLTLWRKWTWAHLKLTTCTVNKLRCSYLLFYSEQNKKTQSKRSSFAHSFWYTDQGINKNWTNAIWARNFLPLRLNQQQIIFWTRNIHHLEGHLSSLDQTPYSQHLSLRPQTLKHSYGRRYLQIVWFWKRPNRNSRIRFFV